jgi:hypothetical protein
MRSDNVLSQFSQEKIERAIQKTEIAVSSSPIENLLVLNIFSTGYLAALSSLFEEELITEEELFEHFMKE